MHQRPDPEIFTREEAAELVAYKRLLVNVTPEREGLFSLSSVLNIDATTKSPPSVIPSCVYCDTFGVELCRPCRTMTRHAVYRSGLSGFFVVSHCRFCSSKSNGRDLCLDCISQFVV